MKNPAFLLLNVLFMILASVLVAQELPNVTPPTPEAASLGKFSEIPISHYTGLPNISVPISSVSVGNKSFPVSISYHARGIQVSEISSRVGMGWALNAGGAITRKTMGLADDAAAHGYVSNFTMGKLADQTFFTDSILRINQANGQSSYDYDDKYPDQYSIQAGSLSTKFILDYNDIDNPLIQKYSDLNITYGPTGNEDFGDRFIVTDSDGYIYYFGISKDGNRDARDYDWVKDNCIFPQNSGSSCNSPVFEQIYNSWKLMDVESPNGDLISFHYSQEITTSYRRSYDDFDQGHNSPYFNLYVNYSNKVESYQHQLLKITHSGGEILFDAASTSRQDLRLGYALEKVRIKDTNGQLIKTFDLYQSYRDALVDNNQNSALLVLEPEAEKRLFLDSIVETGKNNISKPPYVFEYNPQDLPNRFSNSLDYWGMYNGADNGNFLTFENYSSNYVDRAVNEEKSLAGMLERITYPTGGSTKFIYEHNRGLLGPEFDGVIIPNTNPVESATAELGSLHFNFPQYYDGTEYSTEFTIDNLVGGAVNYDIWFQDPSNCSNDQYTLGCNFRVYIEGNGTQVELFLGSDSINTLSSNTTYTLRVVPQHSGHDPISNTDHHFGVTVSWDQTFPGNTIYATGKRIKRIEFYDSGNNLVSHKAYEYRSPLLGNPTSGRILGLSAFHALHPASSGNLNILQMRGAVPGSPFTSYQGNTIGYEYVTEYYGDATANFGKTLYKFTIHRDTGDFVNYPFHAPTDNEWLRGLPLEISHYKNNSDGTYSLVKKTENDYGYAENEEVLIFTPNQIQKPINEDVSLYQDPDLNTEGLPYQRTRKNYRLPLIWIYYTDPLDTNNDEYSYATFHFTGGAFDQVKTTETLYDDNENPTLVTETETGFDYDNHYQPAEITSVTSDGQPITQSFTYPQDLESNYTVHPATYDTDPIRALAEQHRFVSLETNTFKDLNSDGNLDLSERLSRTKTNYAWDGNVLEPSLIQTAKNIEALQDRIEFKDYDDQGNLIQVAKTEGMDICYVYGYDKTLPVAKIENATYAQVQPYVNGIQNASNADDDNCLDSGSCDEKNLRTAINSLRTNLPNAMVTSYTYDPLVGVTSITDPKGYTIYYEYDDLYRLVRVKDADGNIISENKYKYLLD